MGWTMDFTGPQMVLTLKLVSIAFCYHDSMRPATELSESQKRKVLDKLPSVLEFYGCVSLFAASLTISRYVYFYPSFLAGPVVEYADYRDYLSGKQFADSVRDPEIRAAHPRSRAPQYCNGKIPSTILPTLRQFARAIACVAVMVVGGMFVPTYLITKREFTTLPTLLRFASLSRRVRAS